MIPLFYSTRRQYHGLKKLGELEINPLLLAGIDYQYA
jgi:hypothetical protein